MGKRRFKDLGSKMNEDVEGVTYSKYKAESHKVEDEFLFGVSLHLG
jgi:hypothetical protein